jgi:hypothetical protein
MLQIKFTLSGRSRTLKLKGEWFGEHLTAILLPRRHIFLEWGVCSKFGSSNPAITCRELIGEGGPQHLTRYSSFFFHCRVFFCNLSWPHRKANSQK